MSIIFKHNHYSNPLHGYQPYQLSARICKHNHLQSIPLLEGHKHNYKILSLFYSIKNTFVPSGVKTAKLISSQQ